MDKKIAFLLVISVVSATFIFYVSGLSVAVHEVGHGVVCEVYGGDAECWVTLRKGGCKCNTEGWNRFQLLLYYSGGIIAELSIATILILTPPLSIAGGIMYLSIANNLVAEIYDRDISLMVSDVSPRFSILQDETTRYLILAVGFGIFVVSLIHTYNSFTKEK